ncbi:TolC family protein [Dokdonella sp.]|uniref:TolC family protein n=1 Tax=Dokdonella sp. TaxID=2291710 RepID=UPI0025BD1234|nr:TolC family protein [Dokdonella sp.]MBX3692575.1 TolC family protein [Dokdonella sp.]MCW5568407.1 TolC family protein [Dokdonella sp.]
MKSATRGAVLGLAVAVSACAPFEARRGIDETRALTAARGVDLDMAAAADCTTPANALAQTSMALLDSDRALAVALACNATLAAEQARLGIANAEAFEARRLANPELSLGAARVDGGGTRIDFGIAQNFTQLILRGARTRLAEGEFLRAQQLLAGRVIELAAEVETARVQLVTARQRVQARALIAEASDAAAELAERYRAAGNLPAREVALARARAAEASAARRRADEEVAAARARLQRLLGVTHLDADLVGDASLVPVAIGETPDALRMRALQQRLDLVAARGLVDLLADSARTTQRLGWLGAFEVEVEGEREAGTTRLVGPTLTIQLPLFQQGQGARARADALVAWSRAERRRLEIAVASEVDEAIARLDAAASRVADYRERIRPARAAVVARMQEEVNWMLRGVFDLIDARIDELEAAADTFEALGDYALTRAALERATGVRLPRETQRVIEASTLLGDGADLVAPPVVNPSSTPGGDAQPHHEHGEQP